MTGFSIRGFVILKECNPREHQWKPLVRFFSLAKLGHVLGLETYIKAALAKDYFTEIFMLRGRLQMTSHNS